LSIERLGAWENGSREVSLQSVFVVFGLDHLKHGKCSKESFALAFCVHAKAKCTGVTHNPPKELSVASILEQVVRR